MTWHAALTTWLDQDRKRAWLEDVIVRAGLAHVLPWSVVQRMLEAMDEDGTAQALIGPITVPVSQA